MNDSASRSAVLLYLACVVGLGAATVVTLSALFTGGFPRFLSALRREPMAAVRADPASPALALASVGLVLLLVATVVVFGARYGPDPDDERPEGAERDSSEK